MCESRSYQDAGRGVRCLIWGLQLLVRRHDAAQRVRPIRENQHGANDPTPIGGLPGRDRLACILKPRATRFPLWIVLA
jgi:hypothetical protein